MAKQSKLTIVKEQQTAEPDPKQYEEIEKEVTFVCPKRGKVTQKVKVKVYPTGGTPTTQTCH